MGEITSDSGSGIKENVSVAATWQGIGAGSAEPRLGIRAEVGRVIADEGPRIGVPGCSQQCDTK